MNKSRPSLGLNIHPYRRKGVTEESVGPRVGREQNGPEDRPPPHGVPCSRPGRPPRFPLAPKTRSWPSPSSDSRFSMAPGFRRVPGPSSRMPQPSPLVPAATFPGRATPKPAVSPARYPSDRSPTERREGQGASSKIQTARIEKRLCFYFPLAPSGGGRGINSKQR